MQVVIFAGGYGTRLSEETELKPKPMIEIGGHPILWHIMKIYSHFGYDDFIICCGYKGATINDYFSNYFERNSAAVSFDFRDDKKQTVIHSAPTEKWKVTLVDTGLETQTAGRLLRVKDFIEGEEFCLTYGDGVSDVDISSLIDFHRGHGKIATVTAVQPRGRFGALNLQDESVIDFIEKPLGDKAWINGGFFVLNREVFDYLPQKSDDVMWEQEPMENLVRSSELKAFKHYGFWQPMDTLREKHHLENLIQSNKASWMHWAK